MAKYVNVDTVHKSLKSLCNKYKISFGSHYGGFGEEIAKLSSQLPAVDVVPIKHGKWKDVFLFECSNCHAQTNSKLFKSNLHYCPNCGAKMDLEDKK